MGTTGRQPGGRGTLALARVAPEEPVDLEAGSTATGPDVAVVALMADAP